MTDLRTIATELYAVPLADFVARRNERARDVTDQQLAKQVKALRKPNAAAWAVNALARERSGLVEEILELGDELRDAQSDADGTRLRLLDRTRRELSAKAVTEASSLADASGGNLSAAAASALEETLLAAMTDPDAAAAVQEGLLVDAFTASPFEPVDLSGVVALHPVSSRKPTERARRPVRKASEQQNAKGPSQEQARHRAEAATDLAEAERAAESAATVVNEHADERAHLEEELQRLRDEAARIHKQVTDTERALKAVHTHEANARRAARTAQDTRDKARARLDRLGG